MSEKNKSEMFLLGMTFAGIVFFVWLGLQVFS